MTRRQYLRSLAYNNKDFVLTATEDMSVLVDELRWKAAQKEKTKDGKPSIIANGVRMLNGLCLL